MNWQERISINPNICHGKPCIRGTRIMVSIILDYLGSGESVDTIMLEYPGLKKEDVNTVLSYAAWLKQVYSIISKGGWWLYMKNEYDFENYLR